MAFASGINQSLSAGGLAELAGWYESFRESLPPLPGSEPYTINARNPLLASDLSRFPSAFLYDLPAREENGVAVYDLTIAQDRNTRDIVFLDADGRLVYAVKPSESLADSLARRAPFLSAMLATEDAALTKESVATVQSVLDLYDPARVQVEVTLIDTDEVAAYERTSARVSRAAAASRSEPVAMAMRSVATPTDLHISGISRSSTGMCLSIFAPTDFTNRVDVFSSDDLMQSNWLISAEYVSCNSGSTVDWTDTGYEADDMLFYRLGNADFDGDGDGLSDAREIFIHRTDRFNAHSDEDRYNDGEEVDAGSDPLDRYSVPPLPMITASGTRLVNEEGEPVVLKSLSIGGWQSYEHWMLGCEPTDWIVTNFIGRVYAANKVPEDTLRELLQRRFDHSVTLMATNINGYLNVTPNCSDVTGFISIGGFSNGDWIRFDNVDLGSGVNRIIVAAAITNNNRFGGQYFDVHLDSSSGPRIGSALIGSSGSWFHAAKYEGRITNAASGTHTIFVKGRSTSGDVGNFVGMRLYSHADTDTLLTTLRDAYFKTNDFDRIQALGYNCIRLPFLYTLLEDDAEPFVYKQNGWQQLDDVIDECAERGLYCILDLHGVPGGQSFMDHNGVPDGLNNRYWDSDWFRQRVASLWTAIAAHYSNNTAVAGYELFNEPDPWISTNETHVDGYLVHILPEIERLYTAIRSNDTQHIIFLPSNFMYTNMWGDIEAACPLPADKGWTNVCYTFHHYDQTGVWSTNETEGWKFEVEKGVVDEMTRFYTRFMKRRNCPVYIGEFNPGDPQNYDVFLRQFNDNGINWGHWNFRSWGWTDTSRPERRWDGWGIDHRTDPVANRPNLVTNNYQDLLDNFATYSYEYYSPHETLQSVIKNNNTRALEENVYSEFYLNTFGSLDEDNIYQGWPWKKIVGIGNSESFQIFQQQARLFLNRGPVVMRWQSRVEADARFNVKDAAGCWFELQATAFHVTNQVANPEAEVRLCVVRDEITSEIKKYDSPGLIVRMEYDQDPGSNTANLQIYRKTEGTNTWGAEIFSESGVAFSTNALRMHVTANTLTLVYNDATNFTGSHGLDMSDWANGGGCVVEAQDVAGNTEFVQLDNFKAWRENTAPVTFYDGSFTNAPDGMELNALPDEAAVYRNWSNARDTTTYVTNGRVMLIPNTDAWGTTWLNARRDFQNDLRLDTSTGAVAEVSIALSDFTQGWAKIGLLPEYFPGCLYSDYEGQAFYLELERNGGNVKCTAYRQVGIGDMWRDDIGSTVTNAYHDNQEVVVQVSTNWMRVYYDGVMIVDANHEMSNYGAVYEHGLHPHVEFQSNNTTDGIVGVNYLKCCIRESFGEPQ